MEGKAMAVLLFGLLTSAVVVLLSAISVAASDAEKNEYEVTTVLDGNKLGISFYNVYEDTNGEPSVVALDSTKSSIHRLSLPLSQSNAVKHISGGKPGYRDGTIKEALFDHPKKLTVDSDGTIYVADTKNAAIRMITTAGLVTTIAGGSNRTGHNDGEGRVVTFSNDFDVTYLRSTCSLAIVDRGNRMVREIQLPQFIGRCGGATPNSPGRTFTRAANLMSLFLGIVVGGLLTIFTFSTRRLEQWQSKLGWATTKGPHSSTLKKTASSTLQVKETLRTPSSVKRNAAVEESFRTSGNNETTTDLLGLPELQGYNNQTSSISSMSVLPAFAKVRSLLVQRKRSKDFQPASPQVKNSNNLILPDLIDFLEPAATNCAGSVNRDIDSSTATVSGVLDSRTAVAVERVPNIDSMVGRCLAGLTARS